MINEKQAERYCRDPLELIEKYAEAVESVEKYDCHHRDEIRVLPSGMVAIRSKQDLIDSGRYYNCPANELIFMTHAEHMSLHSSVKNPMYGRTCEKNPMYGRTGEKHPMFGKPGPNIGKHFSEEARKKMGDSHRGKTLSEETKKRMSEVRKTWWANRKSSQTSEAHGDSI